MAEGDFNVKAIISAETSNFDRGLKNAQSSVGALSKSIDGISKMLKTAFSAIGITASVGAVVNFGKKAVSAADEANKRFNVLQNTIKATGASTWTSAEELDKMAKSYAESTNYAVSEVEKMQSVLLGFRNITGDTFGEATDAILDMATVMGMDLTSAAQTVGKALDDPIKGLDSLRRQGFQFTDEQKEELEILIKNGKQLEAQQIILNELATTYGGAAKAGQSAFAKLQHQMDQFRENIGNKLMPAVNMIMEQMSKSMENITQVVDRIDFNRVVGIVINVANKIKSILDSIVQYFKETFDNIKNATKSIDFSPLISILETIIGVLRKLVGEVKTRIDETVKIFTSLRDGFSDVIDLKKISSIVNTAIDIYWFLRDQINEVHKNIRELINQTIGKIWNSIKNIFQKSNEALAENEKGFASWADFIWEQVNNVFRIFQDLFGMINQLIKGNWAAAWEYAKLAFMRMADTVLNLFSQIANAFPKLINGVIKGLNVLIEKVNTIRNFLGQEAWNLIEPFESVDLSESSGLNAKIVEAEKKIAELTGKQADYAINEIKKVSTASKGLVTNLIDDITDTTDLIISDSNKAAFVVTSNYDTQTTAASEMYQKLTEWEKKLLQQRLDDSKTHELERHKINLQLLNDEKEVAIAKEEKEEERARIEKYYNKEIEKENKRHIKTITSDIASVVGGIANMMKNIATTVISGIKTLFSSFGNILNRLFDFNPDEALDDLLVFEDKILTFFVETLPKIPQFLASAFQSVATLLNTIFDSVNFESLLDNLVDSVTKILKDIPKLIAKAIPKMLKTVSTLFKEFRKILPDLKNTFKVIVEELFKYLPDFVKVELPAFLSDIISLIPTLMGAGSAFIKALVSALPGIIQTIIDAFILILQDPKEIADLAVSIVKAFVEVIMVVVRNIGPLLKALLPAIAEIIIAIFKALPQLLWDLTKSIGSMILDVGKWIVNMIIDGINLMLDGISKVWTWIPGTKGIPHIPHFANGTNNAVKGLALVGEQGPELVKFNGGEQVLNAHNTQKALATSNGNTNNFNVTFNNTLDTTAYTMIQQLKQYNRQMAINGII